MNRSRISSNKPPLHEVPPLSESPHMKKLEIPEKVYVMMDLSTGASKPIRVYTHPRRAKDNLELLRDMGKEVAIVDVPLVAGE
jgi:hypothetical protein